jgi:hypothetical protein
MFARTHLQSRPSYLPERARCDYVVHPLHSEASAQRDGLDVALPRAGKCGEQEAHREGVVDVTEGIDESGVPGTQIDPNITLSRIIGHPLQMLCVDMSRKQGSTP